METKQTNFRSYFYFAIVVIIGLCCAMMSQQCENRRAVAEKDELYKVSQDSVKLWRDREGLSNAKIAVFEAVGIEAFTQLEVKDRMINNLQTLVKQNETKLKNQGVAGIVTTKGEANIVTITEPIDTTKYVLKGDIKFPIYNSTFKLQGEGKTFSKEGWVIGNVSARVDSTLINLKYRDSMTIVVGREKTGFLGLGKGKPFANVKLFNPYSEVEDMKVFQTSLPPPKKITIGPTLIYGVGQNFQVGVFVGVGIQYSLIRL